MTPEPQKEYIITAELLVKLKDAPLQEQADEIAEIVRQRRYTDKHQQVLNSLKRHVAWLKEMSRNQLFDAHMIEKMIEEAELRQQGER